MPFIGLWLDAPESVLIDRTAQRRNDASDADASVVRMQRAQDTGDIRWCRLDASLPAASVLSRATDRRATGGPGVLSIVAAEAQENRRRQSGSTSFAIEADVAIRAPPVAVCERREDLRSSILEIPSRYPRIEVTGDRARGEASGRVLAWHTILDACARRPTAPTLQPGAGAERWRVQATS